MAFSLHVSSSGLVTTAGGLPLGTYIATGTMVDQYGQSGSFTFTLTNNSTYLIISPTGAVSTTGELADGTYTATGATSDPAGDTGTFTYTLTVTGPPTPGTGAHFLWTAMQLGGC